MDLHDLQLKSNAKLQAALDKIVVLSTTNSLYIKDISQKFSVSSSIDLVREKSFENQINKMREGLFPEYKIELVLHMGKFDSAESASKARALRVHCFGFALYEGLKAPKR